MGKGWLVSVAGWTAVMLLTLRMLIANDVAAQSTVPTYSALQALPTGRSPGELVVVGETGRGGVFVWEGANLSREVRADKAKCVYVPPSVDPTGTAGAWVRREAVLLGEVHLDWCGAKGDVVVVTGGSMTAGDATLTAAGTFVEADVGKTIWVTDGASRPTLRARIARYRGRNRVELSEAPSSDIRDGVVTFGTPDASAFNGAIGYANFVGGTGLSRGGLRIILGARKYMVPTTLDPIGVDGVYIRGQGQTATHIYPDRGTLFQWGDGSGSVLGGGLSGVAIRYKGASDSTSPVIKVYHASRILVTEIYAENVPILLFADSGPVSILSSDITLNRIRGTASNTGLPWIHVRGKPRGGLAGSGLYMSEITVSVEGVTNVGINGTRIAPSSIDPANDILTLGRQSLVTGQRFTTKGSTAGLIDGEVYYARRDRGNGVRVYDTEAHARTGGSTGLKDLVTDADGFILVPFSTVATDRVFLLVDEQWDTIQLTDVSTNRFDVGTRFRAETGGVINNVYFQQVIHDFCSTAAIQFLSSDGRISRVRVDHAYLVATDGSIIDPRLSKSGAIREFTISNSDLLFAGKHGVRIEDRMAGTGVLNNVFTGGGRVVTDGSAIVTSSNAKEFRLVGNRLVAASAFSGAGAGELPKYCIRIGARNDHFRITGNDCALDPSRGMAAAYLIEPSISGSRDQLLANNLVSNGTGRPEYATLGSHAVGESPYTYRNGTGARVRVYVRGGAIVPSIQLNGTAVHGGSGITLELEPGDSYTLNYTSRPTVVHQVLP